MVLIEIISFVDEFFNYWDQIKNLSIKNQIDLYPTAYLKDNSYLFEKQ